MQYCLRNPLSIFLIRNLLRRNYAQPKYSLIYLECSVCLICDCLLHEKTPKTDAGFALPQSGKYFS